jgi:uncharacterized protein
MRVAITGATGTIGRALIDELRSRGDEPVALSRDPTRSDLGVETLAWPDPKAEPPPPEALRGTDAVVHLLGEPLAQRWTDAAKREIRDSRVLGTRNLVDGIAALPPEERPRVLLSQSGVGWYGARGDEPADESDPPADDFAAALTRDWEGEAQRAEELGVRVVRTRAGVVLAPRGGALSKMLPFFKAGVGGPVAGGRQYIAWIHLDDAAGALAFLAHSDTASGPYNLTAPEPATNKDFSRTLGNVLRRPAVLPVPGFALRLLYGEMAIIVTTGANAQPNRLRELGYRFRRPDLEDALRAATR